MRWLVIALTIGVAGCGERQSAADAARADSSAAGYAVGVRAETAAITTATGSGAPQPADTGTRRAPTASPPTVAAAATPGTGAAKTAGAASTTSRRDSTQPAPQRTVPNDASAQRTAGDSTPLPDGPVRVNEFLTYDRRSRTVSLQLIAGYNGLNGSLNYNGATNGSHGLYVPTGWRIHVAVTNRDSDLQHSAIVVQKVLPPPIEPTEPAFPAAALPQLDEGLNEDETGTLDFIADRAGQYMIACGVPGHAQAGMWLQLSVANGIRVPAYR